MENSLYVEKPRLYLNSFFIILWSLSQVGPASPKLCISYYLFTVQLIQLLR